MLVEADAEAFTFKAPSLLGAARVHLKSIYLYLSISICIYLTLSLSPPRTFFIHRHLYSSTQKPNSRLRPRVCSAPRAAPPGLRGNSCLAAATPLHPPMQIKRGFTVSDLSSETNNRSIKVLLVNSPPWTLLPR